MNATVHFLMFKSEHTYQEKTKTKTKQHMLNRAKVKKENQ